MTMVLGDQYGMDMWGEPDELADIGRRLAELVGSSVEATDLAALETAPDRYNGPSVWRFVARIRAAPLAIRLLEDGTLELSGNRAGLQFLAYQFGWPDLLSGHVHLVYATEDYESAWAADSIVVTVIASAAPPPISPRETPILGEIGVMCRDTGGKDLRRSYGDCQELPDYNWRRPLGVVAILFGVGASGCLFWLAATQNGDPRGWITLGMMSLVLFAVGYDWVRGQVSR